MKHIYTHVNFLFAFCFLLSTAVSSQPFIEWQKSYGGSNDEWGAKIISAGDNNFLVISSSNSNDKDVPANKGLDDFWLMKIDSTGSIIWSKNYGGSLNDRPVQAILASDGGFFIAGITESVNGDVTANRGLCDVWIIKINSEGVLEWQKTYGGSGLDVAADIIASSDGNIMILASTASTDGDITQNKGNSDIWLIKIDLQGNLIWQKSIGGSDEDYAAKIEEPIEGGYIVAGYSYSTDGDMDTHYGVTSNSDYIIVKTDDLGVKEWMYNYGGNNTDILNYMLKTPDGGYLLAGFSNSDNGNVTGNHGSFDAWLIKINSTGGVQWQKSLGGPDSDIAYSLATDSNGDYLLCGSTKSDLGQVSGNHGITDYWIVKLNFSGPILWQKCLGGSYVDEACNLLLLNDASCIVAGYSESNDENITLSNGGFDTWIVKLSNLSQLNDYAFYKEDYLTIFPNPANSEVIHVNFTDDIADLYSIEIISVEGISVRTIKDISGLQWEIDVSQLPNGIYLLRAVSDKGIVLKKFIKI